MGGRARWYMIFLLVLGSLVQVGVVEARAQAPADVEGSDQPGSEEALNEEVPDKKAADESAAAPAGEGDEATASSEDAALHSFLDKMVVTATGNEAEDFRLPYSVEVLDQDEMQMRRQVRTVPEALTEEPGVMVQKTAHGQGSPFIRGFTGFRTLLLIDGIRLNNSGFRDGPNQYWATIDALSLDRMELVKGPVSVLYGSDAVGGTVNVLTLTPREEGERVPLGGQIYYRAASAENSNTGRVQVQGGGGGPLSFVAGFSLKDYGDLQSGGGLGSQTNTGYGQQDGDIKLQLRLRDDQQLIAVYQQVSIDDAWRTHRTIFGKSWNGTTVGKDKKRVLNQNRALGYLQYLWRPEGKWFSSLDASISYQSQEENRNRIRSNDKRDFQGFAIDTLGAWFKLDKATRKSLWTAGFEYYRDDVSSFRHDFDADGNLTRVRIQGPIADDANYDLAGLYLQNEFQATGRLSLIAGARYTAAKADARKVQDPQTGLQTQISDNWDKLTGNLRFLYDLDGADRWNLFGGVSQAFRAPNLADLTRLDSARSNEIETPSPDLDPEDFLAYELGAKLRLPTVSATLAMFYTEVDNLIIRVPTGRIIEGDEEVTKLNGGNGFVGGVELKGDWLITPTWSLYGDLTWLDGEIDTFPTSAPVLVREPIDRLQPLTGHLRGRWDPPGSKFWAEGLITSAERQATLSSRDQADTSRIPPGGTPGYSILTLRSGWRGPQRLEIGLAVENLTDKDYRIHGSGLNAPGRNFILSLRKGF